MKNIKNYIALVLIVAVFIGCEKATGPDNITNSSGSTKTSLGETIYSPSNLVNMYSQPNTIGVIWITKKKRNDFTVTGGTNDYTPKPFDGEDKSASATFRNLNNTPLSVGDIHINSSIIQELNDIDSRTTGEYYYRGNNDSLDINFGIGKNIISANNNGISFNDSVTFTTPVMLTGLQRGQNISKNQDIQIQWANSRGNGFNEVSIDADYVHSGTSGIMFICDDDGSFTVPADKLKLLPNGLTHVTIRKYEPKYITQANGNRICILGQSAHVVSVNLID